MRLINVNTYELEEFHDENQVGYAILSHRWEEDEVLYRDLSGNVDLNIIRNKKGWYKIQRCCEQAKAENTHYVWVDTCCIDKSSSAELQEAINSMFRWYAKANFCCAFLSDIGSGVEQHHSSSEKFINSKWFERGWTLQELLAPMNVVFYDANWTYLALRGAHADTISQKTGVPIEILQDGLPGVADRPCVAEIMSWASGRKTTRLEDRAYSLLGLFNVNMPLVYGEGEKAFIRLQEEILRYSDDQSIFIWESTNNETMPGLLATSPDCFRTAITLTKRFQSPRNYPRRQPHTITNEGISVQLQLVPLAPRVYGVITNALLVDGPEYLRYNDIVWSGQCSIYLCRLDANQRYARISSDLVRSALDGADDQMLDSIDGGSYVSGDMRQITVVRTMRDDELRKYREKDFCAFRVDQLRYLKYPTGPYKPLRYTQEVTATSRGQRIMDLLYGYRNMFVRVIKHERQEWTNSPSLTPVFSAIALGFDYEFSPVCLVDLSEKRVHNYANYSLASVMRGNLQWSQDVHPSMSSTIFAFPFASSFNLGCKWAADGEILLIKMELGNRDGNRGFKANFHRQTSRGTVAQISLTVSRKSSEKPWEVSCLVTES